MKMRSAKNSTEPITGPNTVAAPPSSSAVQQKKVSERPIASGCIDAGRM